MSEAEKTVFISYRRKVSSFIARAIFLDLRTHGYDVFMDVESIDSGTFDTIILNQIEARAHFLVILTPGTLNRCVNADDWLRKEIEHAMGCERNIVPVLVNNFKFDKKVIKFLTGKLEQLPRLNGLTLPHEYFDAAMERLRDRYLKQPAPGHILSIPRSEQAVVEEKIEEIVRELKPTPIHLNAENYALEAYTQAENDNIDEALENYTKAINLFPEYAAAYGNRGNLYLKIKEFEKAVADYNRVLEINPNDIGAYNNQARALFFLGKLDAALENCDKAIELNPYDPTSYNHRGNIQIKMGNIAQAIADYTKAVALKPDFAIAYNNRGNSHGNLANYASAIDDYTKAIEIDPNYPDPYYNRGIVLYYKGDMEGAIEDYDTAIRLKPDDTNAYIGRAEAYFALKRLDDALEGFKKADDLQPDDNFAAAGLAVTHHAMGNVDEGRRLWQRLVEQDARFKDVDWVKDELNWAEPLVNEARKLIAGLGDKL